MTQLTVKQYVKLCQGYKKRRKEIENQLEDFERQYQQGPTFKTTTLDNREIVFAVINDMGGLQFPNEGRGGLTLGQAQRFFKWGYKIYCEEE